MAHETLRKWGIGLIGAAISGAANGVTVMIVDPLRFNLFDGGARNLASVVIVSAMVGAALYLKQHTLPIEEDDEDARNRARARRIVREFRQRSNGSVDRPSERD
jgi:hypothetical protein